MQPFSVVQEIAVPFDEANLDTNQLCPSRFNKQHRGPHFAKILLHDRRFNADGSEKPDYILDGSLTDAPRSRLRVAILVRAPPEKPRSSGWKPSVFGVSWRPASVIFLPPTASKMECSRPSCRPISSQKLYTSLSVTRVRR